MMMMREFEEGGQGVARRVCVVVVIGTAGTVGAAPGPARRKRTWEKHVPSV